MAIKNTNIFNLLVIYLLSLFQHSLIRVYTILNSFCECTIIDGIMLLNWLDVKHACNISSTHLHKKTKNNF